MCAQTGLKVRRICKRMAFFLPFTSRLWISVQAKLHRNMPATSKSQARLFPEGRPAISWNYPFQRDSGTLHYFSQISEVNSRLAKPSLGLSRFRGPGPGPSTQPHSPVLACSLLLTTYLFSRGASFDEAGLLQGQVTTNHLDLMHSGVSFL